MCGEARPAVQVRPDPRRKEIGIQTIDTVGPGSQLEAVTPPRPTCRPQRGRAGICAAPALSRARTCCDPCADTTPSRRAWSSWRRSSGWVSTPAALSLSHSPRQCAGRPSRSLTSDAAGGNGGDASGRTRPDHSRARWRHGGDDAGGDTVGRAASRRTTARRGGRIDALDFRRIVEPGAAALAAG